MCIYVLEFNFAHTSESGLSILPNKVKIAVPYPAGLDALKFYTFTTALKAVCFNHCDGRSLKVHKNENYFLVFDFEFFTFHC
jgi:hypothetical protein